MSPTEPSDRLRSLVGALGVQSGYWDTAGRWQEAGADSLVAVASCLGAPVSHPERLDDLERYVTARAVRTVASTVVHRGGRVALDVVVPVGTAGPARAVLVLEDGEERKVDVDLTHAAERERRHHDGRDHAVLAVEVDLGDVPVGRHHLLLDHAGAESHATVLRAPGQVAVPGPTDRTWGVLAPLYAVRSETAVGPHVGELVALGRWIDRHGGRLVGTLPLLATYLDAPYDPSPYTPVSQRFWNELFLDLAAAPELAASPEARALVDDPATQRAVLELRDARDFDHRRQYQLVRPVLDALAQAFFSAPASTRQAFDEWRRANPEVDAYAEFRGATDATGTGWHAWGAGAGRLPERRDADAVRTHLYAQWSMHRQLTGVADALAERDQRLYLDLPVGTHGDGFDTWSQHELFAWGCGVGAPPDDFFAAGQNWGFPPVNPLAARDQGHAHLAACIRHHMSAAGVLRLDHVMGFHRLYWVPDGAAATEGVYVRYPQEELFAVLAIESARSGCQVVGEDLGTVPDEVRDALDRYGLLGMYVSQFQGPGADGRVPPPGPRQVASLDTHDTPTFTGWLRACDLEVRRDLGMLDDHELGRAAAERQRDCDHLVTALAAEGLLTEPAGEEQVFDALVRFLGGSDAGTVLLSADDLVHETEPQNVPGTGHDRPNWVRKLREPLASLAADPNVEALLEGLQAARLGAHVRAQEELR